MQGDPFVTVVFASLLHFFVFVISKISSTKEKKIMKKTINSGSRDPKVYYANEKNKQIISFLVVLILVFLIYFITINFSK